MKICFTITMIAICAIIFCSTKFNIIGSYVAADGTLVEPFYLIGLSWIFFFIALFSSIIGALILLRNKKIAHT